MSGACSGRHGRDERGTASVLMAGLMGVVILLWAAAMLVAGYQLAYHRVRAAADLAAVSAAAAFADGADACKQARRSAAENGGRLVACKQVGDQLDYVVAVQVEIRVRSHIRQLPGTVRAWAYAGST